MGRKNKRKRDSSSSDSDIPKKVRKRLDRLEAMLRKKSRLRSRDRRADRLHRHKHRRSRSPRPSCSRARSRSISSTQSQSDRSHKPPSGSERSSVLPPVVEQRDNLGQVRTGACSVVSDDCLDLDASSVDFPSPDDEVVVQNNVNLPNNVLEILGEEPGSKSGVKILLHEQLVTRWGSTIKQGFPKEEALILLDKYSWPDNLPELTTKT